MSLCGATKIVMSILPNGWLLCSTIGNCHKRMFCSVALLLHVRALHLTETNEEATLYLYTRLSYPKKLDDKPNMHCHYIHCQSKL